MNVVVADHLKLCWDILFHCHQLYSVLFKILIHLFKQFLTTSSQTSSVCKLLYFKWISLIFSPGLLFQPVVCFAFFFFCVFINYFIHLSRSQILQLALIDFFHPLNSFSCWTLESFFEITHFWLLFHIHCHDPSSAWHLHKAGLLQQFPGEPVALVSLYPLCLIHHCLINLIPKAYLHFFFFFIPLL